MRWTTNFLAFSYNRHPSSNIAQLGVLNHHQGDLRQERQLLSSVTVIPRESEQATMLLGLLAPLCFFTSSLLAANTVNLQTNPIPLGPLITAEKPYRCIERPQAGEPIRFYPDSTHCAHALDQIVKGDKASAPMLISRTEGYKVPHYWWVGSCLIYINTSDLVPTKPVTLPLLVVVRMALEIMNNCITQGPGLGGVSFLGSWDGSGGVLDLVVVGRDMSQSDMGTPPSDRVAAAIARSFGSGRIRQA